MRKETSTKLLLLLESLIIGQLPPLSRLASLFFFRDSSSPKR